MTLENLSGKPKKSKEVRAIRADLDPEPHRKESTVELNSSGEQSDLLGRGIEGSVTRVTASVNNKETGSLAFKQYRNEGDAMYAKKVWLQFKSLGIPVPQTFRLILDGSEADGAYEGVLMTELTDNWNTIFLTTREGNNYMMDMVYATNPDIVRQFAQEDFSDSGYKEELQAKCRDIAEKLSEAGILLKGGDAIGATYKQSGDIEPILFDYGNVALDGKKSGAGKPLNKEELLKQNLRLTESIAFFVTAVQEDAQKVIEAHESK